MKIVYPVIFTQTDTAVLVEVPDMNILTEGTDILDAIEMARDAIGVKGITMEDMGEAFPPASNLTQIDPGKGTFAEEGSGYVSLVDVDLSEYRRKVDNKMVRMNVTLPNWLNREADRAHVNVSGILRDALMEKLGIAK